MAKVKIPVFIYGVILNKGRGEQLTVRYRWTTLEKAVSYGERKVRSKAAIGFWVFNEITSVRVKKRKRYGK